MDNNIVRPLDDFETSKILDSQEIESAPIDQMRQEYRSQKIRPRLTTDYIVEDINYASLYDDLARQVTEMNPDMVLDAYKNASLSTGEYPQFAALKLKAPALFEQLMSERTRSFTPQEVQAINNPIIRTAKGIAESFSAGWERQDFNRTFYTHLLLHGSKDKNFSVPFDKELKLDYLRTRMQSYTGQGEHFLESGLYGLADMTAQFAVPMATQLASYALAPITGGLSVPAGSFLSSAMVYGNTFLQEGGNVAYDLMYNSDVEMPLDVIYSASASAGTINAALETIVSWGVLKGASGLLPKAEPSMLAKAAAAIGIKPAEKSIGMATVDGLAMFKNKFISNLASGGITRTAIKEMVDFATFYGTEFTEELTQEFTSSYMKSTAEIWRDPSFKKSFLDALDDTIDAAPELMESMWLLYLLPLSNRGVSTIIGLGKDKMLKGIYDKTIKTQKDKINFLVKEGASQEEINAQIANNLKDKRENVYMNIESFEKADDTIKQSVANRIVDIDSRISLYKELGSDYITVNKDEFASILVEEETQKAADTKNTSYQSPVETMFSYSNSSISSNNKSKDGDGLAPKVMKLYEDAVKLKKEHDEFKAKINNAREQIKNKLVFKEIPYSKSNSKNSRYVKSIEDMMSYFYVLAEENGRLDKFKDISITFLDSAEGVSKERFGKVQGLFSSYASGKMEVHINMGVFAEAGFSTGTNVDPYKYIDTIFHELSHYIFEAEIIPILDDVKYLNDTIKDGKFVPKGDNQLLNEIININRNVMLQESYDYVATTLDENGVPIKTREEAIKDYQAYFRTPTEVFARMMVYNYLYKMLSKSSMGKMIFREFGSIVRPELELTTVFFDSISMYKDKLVEADDRIKKIFKEYFLPADTEIFFEANGIEPLFTNKVDLMAVFGLTDSEATAYLKTVEEAKDKTVKELGDLVLAQMNSKDVEAISKDYTGILDKKIAKIKASEEYKFLLLVSQNEPVYGGKANKGFIGKLSSRDSLVAKFSIPEQFLDKNNGYTIDELMEAMGEKPEDTQEYYSKADHYLNYVMQYGANPFKDAYKNAREEVKTKYGVRSFAAVFDSSNRSLTMNASEIINNNGLDRVSAMMLYELNLLNDLMVKKYGVYEFSTNKELLDVINYKYSNMLIRDVVDSNSFLDLVSEASGNAKRELGELYKYTDKDKSILAQYNDLASKKRMAEKVNLTTPQKSITKYIDSLDIEINKIKGRVDAILEKERSKKSLKDKKSKPKREAIKAKINEIGRKLEQAETTIVVSEELKKQLDGLDDKKSKKEKDKIDKSIEKAKEAKLKHEEKIKELQKELENYKASMVLESKLSREVLVNKYKQLSSYMFYAKSVMTNNRIASFNDFASDFIANPDSYQKNESRHTYAMISKFLDRLGFKDEKGNDLKYDPEYTDMTFQELHNKFFNIGTRDKVLPLSNARLSEITVVDDLTTNELINLMNYIQDIRDIGKEYVGLKIEQRKETVSKIRALLTDGLNNLYDFKKAKTIVGGLFQKYIANSTKFSTMIKYITNNDPNHPLLQYTVYKEVALQGQYFKDLEGVTTELTSIYQSLLEDGESVHSHFSKEIVIELNNLKTTVTMETLFMIALNMGNIDNKELMNKYVGRLVDMPKVSEKFVTLLLEKYLPENHMEAVQQIWDMFKKIGIKGFREYEKTHGCVPDGVKPTKLTFKGKEFAGGYFPILLTDTSLSAPATPFQFETGDNEKVLREKSLEEIKYATSISSLTSNKHMEERNNASRVMDSKNDPVIVELTLDRMAVSLTNILKDFAWRRYLSDTNTTLLKDEKMKQLITDKLGPQALYNIKKHIQAIAGVAYDKNTMMGELATFIRKGATTSILGFSIGTGLVQLGGIIPSMNHIGAGNVLFGLKNFNNEYYVNLARKSPLMMDRGKSLNRDIARTKLNLSLHDKVNEVAFAHIIYIDSLIARVTFIGAINKYMDEMYDSTLTKEINEEKAKIFAEHMVNESQGSGLDFTLSHLESINDPLHRLFTMFMTFSMSVMNSLMVSLRKNKFKDRLSAEAMRSVLYYGVAAPLVNIIVRLTWLSLAFGDDEEDKEKSVERMMKEYTSTVLGTFPYFGNIGYSYFVGTPYVDTPMSKLITEYGHVMKSSYNYIKGDNPNMTFDRYLETMASLVGTTANLPIKRPAQMLNSLYQYWENPDYYFIDFLNKNTSNINKKDNR